MKKIISLLLSLLMVFMASAALAETITVKPGDTLTLEVELSSGGGRSAMISIDADGVPVTFVSAVGGSQAGTDYVNDVVPPLNFDDYFVVVNIQSVSLSKDGKNLSGSTGNGEFSLGEVEAGKVGLVTMTVNSNAAAGEYTVEAKTTSGASAGSVTFVVERDSSTGRLAGDANEDGTVNARDAMLILKYTSKWPNITINLENAEVNGDGTVNARDAMLILKFTSKWEGIELK